MWKAAVDGSAIALLQIMAVAALWATVGVGSQLVPASSGLARWNPRAALW